ncbi:MAG: GGDEF domain-containing protein [Lachnospiraceae bacterium]
MQTKELKKRWGELWKYIQKAFIPSKDYMLQDSILIAQKIKGNMAEINCRRIVAVTPVFFLFYVYNFILSMRMQKDSMYYLSVLLTVFLAAVTVAVNVIIGKLRKREQETGKKEIKKLRCVYCLFWLFWILCMATVAYCQILIKSRTLYLVLILVLSVLLPLLNLREFLAGDLLILLFAMSSVVLIDWNTMEAKLGGVCFAALIVVGFIAQRMQVSMWIAREYVYATAFIDPLTGVLNRRGGNTLFTNTAPEEDEELGIMMLDIDFFKKYNDTYGHDAGDTCLKTVGRVLREVLEDKTELIIRHGGEEFVSILTDTSPEEVCGLAEKIRSAIYEKKIEAPCKEVAPYMTVSIGASMERWKKSLETYDAVLKRADEALYEAKRAGKNQVVFYGQKEEPEE